MELITEKMVKDATVGAKSLTDVATGVTTELMNEAVNLFIIEGTLHILKFAGIFIIFFIVKKYLDTMIEANKEQEGLFKALKTTLLVSSIMLFTLKSFPHLIDISKAVVAPKIFLMEKGADLVRGK